MTAEAIQHGSFDPVHSAHAIEQVAFVIQFATPLNDSLLEEVRNIATQNFHELPGESLIQGINIAIGHSVQVARPQFPLGINGVIRIRGALDGTTECELRMERQSITYITTRYTRWNAIWEQVSRYLSALLPVYLREGQLLAIGLNYVDKFIWNGDLIDVKPNELLNEESKYLSRHIFETNQLWHSHTGVFIKADNITKRLLNVNLDNLDELRPEGLKRVVNITTTLTDQFNQQDFEPYVTDNNTINLVFDHMQDMHKFGKTVLADLITKQVNERIALGE